MTVIRNPAHTLAAAYKIGEALRTMKTDAAGLSANALANAIREETISPSMGGTRCLWGSVLRAEAHSRAEVV